MGDGRLRFAIQVRCLSRWTMERDSRVDGTRFALCVYSAGFGQIRSNKGLRLNPLNSLIFQYPKKGLVACPVRSVPACSLGGSYVFDGVVNEEEFVGRQGDV